MKYLLIFSLMFLTGCIFDDPFGDVLSEAKNNPDYKLCFNIHEPVRLIGKYCLKYEGELK